MIQRDSETSSTLNAKYAYKQKTISNLDVLVGKAALPLSSVNNKYMEGWDINKIKIDRV